MREINEFVLKPPAIDWMMLAPIVLVLTTGILALIVEMLRPKQNNNMIVGVSLVGLLVAGISTAMQFGMPTGETLGGMFRRDETGLILQLLLIVITGLTFFFSEGYLRQKKIAYGEFYPLALFSAAGGMMMGTTQNLLMLFMGIEVLSIALYCMAGLSREETRSEEAALKYFLLGAFASAFLLYGIAFYYGSTGSVHLGMTNVALAMGDPLQRNTMVIGVFLMLVGLGFKIAAFPFHQWTPDVYQGAPTNVTAFMATASKAAAVIAAFRVLEGTLLLAEYWEAILFWMAILTMTVGNVSALVQRDVKRALAYSSVAHAGYLLVALAAHFKMPYEIGTTTVMFYLVSYALMNLGVFAIISLTAKNGKEGTRLEDLRGLWNRSPFAAGCLVVFVASLVGIPPTAGFFGKWMIFYEAMRSGLPTLAIVLAVNSALSAFYYLQIAKAAFVEDEGAVSKSFGPAGGGLRSTLVVCAAGTILLGVLGGPFLKVVDVPPTELPDKGIRLPMDGTPPQPAETSAGVSL